MPDEAVTKQIEGVCDEISEKNGWTSFAINVGTEWPVRLSTKLPALIDQGRAAGGEHAVWTFKESQGKENPNKPGTHYMNRYLSGVEVGGALMATQASAGAAHAANSTARRPPSDDPTRGSIERQTIVKAAIDLYPTGLVKSDADFFFLLAKLERFCAHGSDSALSGEDPDNIPF